MIIIIFGACNALVSCAYSSSSLTPPLQHHPFKGLLAVAQLLLLLVVDVAPVVSDDATKKSTDARARAPLFNTATITTPTYAARVRGRLCCSIRVCVCVFAAKQRSSILTLIFERLSLESARGRRGRPFGGGGGGGDCCAIQSAAAAVVGAHLFCCVLCANVIGVRVHPNRVNQNRVELMMARVGHHNARRCQRKGLRAQRAVAQFTAMHASAHKCRFLIELDHFRQCAHARPPGRTNLIIVTGVELCGAFCGSSQRCCRCWLMMMMMMFSCALGDCRLTLSRACVRRIVCIMRARVTAQLAQ